MMLKNLIIYQQSTGKLWIGGTIAAQGYSGKGAGRNNHAMQATRSVGPIPVGVWLLDKNGESGEGYPSPTAYSIKLEEGPDTEAFGRTGFYIHGDNPTSTASRGCPVIRREVRRRILEDANLTHLLVIQ